VIFNRMNIYTVHVKPESGLKQKPVFIREGFNLAAFIFAAFWTLYQRLWLPSMFVVAFNLFIIFLASQPWLSPATLTVLDMGLHMVVGFMANDWLRAGMQKRGYVFADITAADSLLRAEQRYFERYLATTS
jgi:hypothetical protein